MDSIYDERNGKSLLGNAANQIDIINNCIGEWHSRRSTTEWGGDSEIVDSSTYT